MRAFVTGRGNITLSTCATVCFILLYSKDTKRIKITGKNKTHRAVCESKDLLLVLCAEKQP